MRLFYLKQKMSRQYNSICYLYSGALNCITVYSFGWVERIKMKVGSRIKNKIKWWFHSIFIFDVAKLCKNGMEMISITNSC